MDGATKLGKSAHHVLPTVLRAGEPLPYAHRTPDQMLSGVRPSTRNPRRVGWKFLWLCADEVGLCSAERAFASLHIHRFLRRQLFTRCCPATGGTQRRWRGKGHSNAHSHRANRGASKLGATLRSHCTSRTRHTPRDRVRRYRVHIGLPLYSPVILLRACCSVRHEWRSK